MNIDRPVMEDVPALRRLWQQAFGDPDAFLDSFFRVGFSQDRCRCVKKDGVLAAAHYWFDCDLGGKKLAYLYAVATDEAYRRQGLCAALLEDTHRHLKALGYEGAVLVPGEEALRRYYRRFGYEDFGGLRKQRVSGSDLIAALRSIDKREYALLRRQYLPKGGIVQEGAMLDLLAQFSQFYAGEDFVLAVTQASAELLGKAPQICVAAPEEEAICLRTPGDTPFAMYLPLTGKKEYPAYFGIGLD